MLGKERWLYTIIYSLILSPNSVIFKYLFEIIYDIGGKGKKYLKAEAIPSRYLELDNDDGFKVTDLDQTSSPVFILPSISQCSKEECTDIFLKTKILQTENRYIPSLVPNQYYLLSR